MPLFCLTRGAVAHSSEGISRRKCAQGVVRQLGVIAPPDQELPGAVARPIVLEDAEPLGQHAPRSLELVLASATGERGLDQLRRYAAPAELELDPLGAPSAEGAAIFGEALCVVGVVEHPGALELGHDFVDQLGIDPLALEIGPELRDRAIADRQGSAGEVERPPQFLLRRRQAAFSSGASASSAGAGISATVPPSCAIPTAS